MTYPLVKNCFECVYMTEYGISPEQFRYFHWLAIISGYIQKNFKMFKIIITFFQLALKRLRKEHDSLSAPGFGTAPDPSFS